MGQKFNPNRPCAEAGAHDPKTGALIGKWLVQDGCRFDLKTKEPLDAPAEPETDEAAKRNAELAKAFSGGGESGATKPPRKVTPAAERLAQNFNVNVEDIALGTGKDGAVTMDDVKAYIEAQKGAPPSEGVDALPDKGAGNNPDGPEGAEG